MSEAFSLSWSDFETASSTTIRDLFSDLEFADVTLASHDEEQIKAHKVILCAASPFFKRIISNNPHQHPLLFLRNIKMNTLKSIIGFIYMGVAEVEQEDLEHFLNIAKELEVKGLSNEIDTTESSKEGKGWEKSVVANDQNNETEEIFQDSYNQLNFEEIDVKQTHIAFTNDKENTKDIKNVYDEPKPIVFDDRHANSVPDSLGKFRCYNCDYKANSPGNLQIHEDAVHRGVRYPCDQCDYKATQKSSLKRHARRHSSIVN